MERGGKKDGRRKGEKNGEMKGQRVRWRWEGRRDQGGRDRRWEEGLGREDHLDAVYSFLEMFSHLHQPLCNIHISFLSHAVQHCP